MKSHLCFAFGVVSALVAFGGSANAQQTDPNAPAPLPPPQPGVVYVQAPPGSAPPPVAAPAPAAPQEELTQKQKEKIEKDKIFRQFSIELNPLALAIGRYSIQGEYLPAPHHAIVLNPHYDHVSVDASDNHGYSEGFSGFGAELGYRFYTSKNGPGGFYVGPSFLFASYSTSVGASSIASATATGNTASSFTSVGGAIDIGGQGVIGPGIVIGGGFGLQYTSVSANFTDLPLTALIIAGGGVRPRFLFTIGYAF